MWQVRQGETRRGRSQFNMNIKWTITFRIYFQSRVYHCFKKQIIIIIIITLFLRSVADDAEKKTEELKVYNNGLCW